MDMELELGCNSGPSLMAEADVIFFRHIERDVAALGIKTEDSYTEVLKAFIRLNYEGWSKEDAVKDFLDKMVKYYQTETDIRKALIATYTGKKTPAGQMRAMDYKKKVGPLFKKCFTGAFGRQQGIWRRNYINTVIARQLAQEARTAVPCSLCTVELLPTDILKTTCNPPSSSTDPPRTLCQQSYCYECWSKIVAAHSCGASTSACPFCRTSFDHIEVDGDEERVCRLADSLIEARKAVEFETRQFELEQEALRQAYRYHEGKTFFVSA
jgi:hypothetical protein